MSDGLFESCARPERDFAGVFEYDGETGYFYLCDLTRKEGQTIMGAIHITSAEPDFVQSDVKVIWNRSHTHVGVMLRGRLWAVFSVAGERFGGDYALGTQPVLPGDVESGF